MQLLVVGVEPKNYQNKQGRQVVGVIVHFLAPAQSGKGAGFVPAQSFVSGEGAGALFTTIPGTYEPTWGQKPRFDGKGLEAVLEGAKLLGPLEVKPVVTK